jgi:IS30 family transposase
MTKNYHHLKSYQRYQIEALLSTGKTQKDIANSLNVHASTISRELRRNSLRPVGKPRYYQADKADHRCQTRHKEKPKRILFTSEMKQWTSKCMREERWSPELISVMGRKAGTCVVSHEWIYQWIWSCKRSHSRENRPYKYLYELLKHGKRHRKRGNKKGIRSKISGRVPIEERPIIVNKRERPGDVEVDLMVGKNHKGILLVITDRATLYTQLTKLASKNAEGVAEAIIQSVHRSDLNVKTLTFDNDMAFASHIKVGKALQAKTYFTRPYTSQDKGTVENRIGVIRRFIPKKTDIRLLGEEAIREIEEKINLRPVRKFKYLNPKQVLSQKIALIT